MTRVFVNGCFDIIHVGHIRLLEFAATLGRVVVAVNGDRSITTKKGPNRPINQLHDRMEVLRSIKHVHGVISFHEDTPCALLNFLYEEARGPDIVVKGQEYEAIEMPERKIIEDNGGKIIFFRMVENRSTSLTINRMPEQ